MKELLTFTEFDSERPLTRHEELAAKGEGEDAENIKGGTEYSTLANDAFPAKEFDFMRSNPPYGKSWKTGCGPAKPAKSWFSSRCPLVRIHKVP